MRRAIVVVVLLSVVGVASASAANDPTMNKRTRAFVAQMRGCQTIVGLAIKIMQSAPNDLIGASEAVNSAKSTCSAIGDRMATMNESHFSDQALNGEVAVDYWTRGLGRVSNYIDDARPSDIATAAQYFTTARQSETAALSGINAQRAVYGLDAIK